jgi:hypothetical protein
MGDVIRFPNSDGQGQTAAVEFLLAVRRSDGIAAVMRCAEEMITAASAIIAWEAGLNRARHVLARADQALPPDGKHDRQHWVHGARPH